MPFCFANNSASSWEFRQSMWHVRLAKAHISLCIHAVWSEPYLFAWTFYRSSATHRLRTWVAKLKERLHKLIWVYTVQHGTLLEISGDDNYILSGKLSGQSSELIEQPVKTNKQTKKKKKKTKKNESWYFMWIITDNSNGISRFVFFEKKKYFNRPSAAVFIGALIKG